MDTETRRARFPASVTALGWASFLHDLGSDMISPIWPVFVTTVLGANLTILGLIDGLGDALVALSQVVSGYLSDKIQRRKPFIWLGYCFGGLARIGYAGAVTWPEVIPFKVMDRIGKLRDAPRDALVADISMPERRGRHFGFLRAMDNLGAVCGIVTSILLLPFLGYRHLFMVAAIPSLIGALLLILVIREPASGRSPRQPFGFRLYSRSFTFVLIASAVFALGTFSYSFLLLVAKSFGFPVLSLPLLYLLFTAVASATSWPFGNLADHMSKKSVMIFAFGLWALVCAILLVSQSHAAVILAFGLYGVHLGALQPVQKAFVSGLVPPETRASGLGGFQMVIGLVALPASFLAGVLWDRLGVTAMFTLSLSLTIIALTLLMLVRGQAAETQATRAV